MYRTAPPSMPRPGLGYSFGWGAVGGARRVLDYQMKSGSVIEKLDFNGPGSVVAFHW